jgi:hypothetical protein
LISFCASAQDIELMPQYHDLGVQLLSRLMRPRHDADNIPVNVKNAPLKRGIAIGMPPAGRGACVCVSVAPAQQSESFDVVGRARI